MALKRTSLAICLLLFNLAASQFVSPPPDSDFVRTKGYSNVPVRYKQVPDGICELTPGVKSYTGYVDIAENQHIFFWFFEARNQDPKHAPLTIWVNGGPGSSSMLGLFQELGPCGVDPDGNLYDNPYAWNNVSNMVFIDHPSMVGFSYSEAVPLVLWYTDKIHLPDSVCPDWASLPDQEQCVTRSYANLTDTANSSMTYAESMWTTLQGFMGAFPDYSRSGIHLATESYGGHYFPVFAAYVLAQNKMIKRNAALGFRPLAHPVDLRTLTIGNGWYDPVIAYISYYNYSIDPGNPYDVHLFNQTIADRIYNSLYGRGNCVDQLNDCNARGIIEVCAYAYTLCNSRVSYPYDDTGRDFYDIRELMPNPFPYTAYEHYLNTEKVQKAIGAYTNYTNNDTTIDNTFESTGDIAREDGIIGDLQDLVQQGIYVYLYAGDSDYLCSWYGSEATADQINPPGYSTAGYANITTSDAIVHGVVKQSANFAFARVYYAGHYVPFYQPLLALEMFNRSINGLDIATGEINVKIGSSYKTDGPAQSLFHQGNGTVNFKVLPEDATYNATLYGANPPAGGGKESSSDDKKKGNPPVGRKKGRAVAMSRSGTGKKRRVGT